MRTHAVRTHVRTVHTHVRTHDTHVHTHTKVVRTHVHTHAYAPGTFPMSLVLRVPKKEEYHLHDTTINTKRCNYFSKN